MRFSTCGIHNLPHRKGCQVAQPRGCSSLWRPESSDAHSLLIEARDGTYQLRLRKQNQEIGAITLAGVFAFSFLRKGNYLWRSDHTLPALAMRTQATMICALRVSASLHVA
jgi:hypothetical protein